jgi:hypothetical protein
MMLTSSLTMAGHLALTEQNHSGAETKADEPCQKHGGIWVVYFSCNPLENSHGPSRNIVSPNHT